MLPLLIAFFAGTMPLAAAHDETVVFESGFDGADKVSDLFKASPDGWTGRQVTDPANTIDFVSDIARAGKAVRIFAAGESGRGVSKASLEKGGLDLREGERIRISAWIFIPREQDPGSLFLMDLECESCWPEASALPNKSPGVRVAVARDGSLLVERGKIGFRHKNFEPSAEMRAPLPRNRWVHLEWAMTLSTKDDGLTELFLDGARVLRATGVNMLSPSVFAGLGIQLQLPVRYDRFQIGITANPSGRPATLYIDDVRISVEPA